MALLTRESLQTQGAFTGRPVEKEVFYTGINEAGEVVEYSGTVYVRQASYKTVTDQWKAVNEEQDGTAARIVNMIVDEAGQPIFTMEDITGDGADKGPLSESLTIALLNAIGEVNKVAVKADEEKK